MVKIVNAAARKGIGDLVWLGYNPWRKGKTWDCPRFKFGTQLMCINAVATERISFNLGKTPPWTVDDIDIDAVVRFRFITCMRSQCDRPQIPPGRKYLFEDPAAVDLPLACPSLSLLTSCDPRPATFLIFFFGGRPNPEVVYDTPCRGQ